MKLRTIFGVSMVICALTGCSSRSSWDSPIAQSIDHPQNGLEDFPLRIEVAGHRCGLLRRACATVRFVDETGITDIFTFIGKPEEVSVAWIDFHHLQISCDACGRTIELQRKDTIYQDNILISYKI